MKSPWLTALLALSLALPVSAQPDSFTTLFSAPAHPAKLKISELPTGYKPVRLQLAEGGTGMGSLLGSSSVLLLGLFGSLFGSSADQAPLAFLNVIDVAWTTGETIHVSGQDYLVTYKLGLGLVDLATLDQVKGMSQPELKLTLVRTGAIQTISPEPQLTRAQFADAIQQLSKVKPKSKDK